MQNQKHYTLNNGIQIPKIGFGTDYLKGKECINAVIKAIEVGYRLIDTARIYDNEKEIGIAVKECIKKGLIKRSDILIQTKVAWYDVGYEQVLESYNKSLKELDLEYIDLYCLHQSYVDSFTWQEDIRQNWKAMEYLYDVGKVRAIGVCNFSFRSIALLTSWARVCPSFNQIELHPQCQHNDLVAFCKNRNILIQPWSALNKGKIFDIESIKTLCKQYGKNCGQIAIAWSIQKGYAPLVRSSNPEHIRQNFDIYDVELSQEAISILDSLDGSSLPFYDMESEIPIGQIPSHRFYRAFNIGHLVTTKYKFLGLTVAKSIRKNSDIYIYICGLKLFRIKSTKVPLYQM